MSDLLSRSSVASSPSRQYLIQHSALQGAQLSAVLAPFLYGSVAFYRRTFSLAGLLRACTIGFVGVGPMIGALVGYGAVLNKTEAYVVNRARLLKANTSQKRLEDYTLIGAVVGALVVPAIFLKRARLPYTVLGGASLGAADGVATHVYKGYSEGIYDKGPKGVVEEEAGKKL